MSALLPRYADRFLRLFTMRPWRRYGMFLHTIPAFPSHIVVLIDLRRESKRTRTERPLFVIVRFPLRVPSVLPHIQDTRFMRHTYALIPPNGTRSTRNVFDECECPVRVRARPAADNAVSRRNRSHHGARTVVRFCSNRLAFPPREGVHTA